MEIMMTNASQALSRPTNELPERFGRFAVFAFIFLSVIAVRFAIPSAIVADYDAYVQLADYLSFRPRNEWISFEPLSSLLLVTLRQFTGSGYKAVAIAHIMLSVAYVAFVYKAVSIRDVTWQGILLSFGLYGSALAFVLLRGTPAYLLIVFALIDAVNGRRRSALFALAAIGFHISALLAVPALLAAYLQNRSPIVARFFGGRAVVFLGAGLVLALSVASIPAFLEYTNIVIRTFSQFIGKYATYFETANDLEKGRLVGAASNNHFYYTIVVSALVLFYLTCFEPKAIALRAYVVSSYVIFVVLSLSPVVAFRQSIFWVLPLVILFPWDKYAFRGFGTFFIILASLGGFYFGVGSIIAPF